MNEYDDATIPLASASGAPPTSVASPPNPQSGPASSSAIPAELRAEPRWVVARIPSKVPLCAFDPARNASSTDPSTWSDFDAACHAIDTDPTLHLGFMLGDGFVGVDLDKCRNADTGACEPWAQQIVDRLDSYTETSVSGTGIH